MYTGMTLCTVVDRYQRFETIRYPHLQDTKNNIMRNIHCDMFQKKLGGFNHVNNLHSAGSSIIMKVSVSRGK
jgi:hypothetical protein